MKLSYQNIGILQNLFEGVEVIYEHCNCEPGYCRNCEPWVSKIRIGEVSFKARETHIEATNTGHKYGGLTFTDTTTVADFKALCAHLGVELVEKKSHPCKHCGQPYKKHSSVQMCPTQFTFYVADLEE
jgi:hypothetical protein